MCFKTIISTCYFNGGQEGAEEDIENNNNDDVPVEPEADDKGEEQPVERPRKTSKYMTKYERARILGTRALQIRFILSLF